MGILNRLFGSKQPDVDPELINGSLATMEQYLRGIMSSYGDTHFQSDTSAKQILSVYAFGGISVLAIQKQLSPPQAHAICLALFNGFFGYGPADAAAKAQAVITAAPDKTSHLYAIIHRGADGFIHWQKNAGDGAAKDFASIMGKLQNAGM